MKYQLSALRSQGSIPIPLDLLTMPFSISGCLILFCIIITCIPYHISHAKTPKNRLDTAGSYTWISVGDWQRMALNYSRQWHKNWNAGLGGYYFRRILNQQAQSDLSLVAPVYYTHKNLTLKTQVDLAPQASILPLYALELAPSYRLDSIPFTLFTRYRYVNYDIAYAHVSQSAITYHANRFDLAAHMYLILPQFGSNLLTPQIRLNYRFNYFWRLAWWSTYGYETLNERFVDPNRQAIQWSNFIQVRHLLTDWQGINLGVSYVHFLAENEQMASEIFNQNRLEASLHYFVRF